MGVLVQTFLSLAIAQTPPREPPVIGSNTPYPTLQASIDAGVIETTNGIVTQGFRVDGVLKILQPRDLAGIEISGSNGTIEINGDVIFSNCNLSEMTTLAFDTETATIHNCSISDLDVTSTGTRLNVRHSHFSDARIDLSRHSRPTSLNTAHSYFLNAPITCAGSRIHARRTTFDDAPIKATRAFVVIVEDSHLQNADGKAIDLEIGVYSGSNNLFENNHISIYGRINEHFLIFEERNSTFRDPMCTPFGCGGIGLIDATDVKITGCTFSESVVRLLGGTGPTIFADNSLTITDHPLNYEGFALLHVANRPQPVIKDNSLIVNKGIDGIRCTNTNKTEIRNNTISGSPSPGHRNGIALRGCIAGIITDNDIDGALDGIFLEASTVVDVKSNTVSNSISRGMTVSDSLAIVSCGNTLTGGHRGVTVLGNCYLLNLIANDLSNNDYGLVLGHDAFTGPQVEHGNIFGIKSSIGAWFQGSPSPDQIAQNQFVVRDDPSEFPIHTPLGWFDPQGQSADDCPLGNPFGLSNPQREAAKLRWASPSEVDGGRAFMDQFALIETVRSHPELLNDRSIREAYESLLVQPVSELLTIADFARLIPTSLPAFGFPFVRDQEGNLVNWEELDVALSQYSEMVNHVNTGFRSELDSIRESQLSIQPNHWMGASYIELSVMMLEFMETNELSTEQQRVVQDTASGCVDMDGPAVLLARVLAAAADLSWENGSSCDS